MNAVIVSRGSLDHVLRIERELRDHFESIYHLKLGLDSDNYEAAGDLTNPIIRFRGVDFSTELLSKSFFVLADFSVHPVPWIGVDETFASREWNALVEGALSIWCRAAWRCPIRPANRHLYDRKPFLAAVGAQVGARLPGSQIATEFRAPQGDFVMKAINGWQEVAPFKYLNTRRMAESDLRQLEGADLAGPVMLQNFIAHSREYRVYLAGKRVTAILLESDDSTVVDFRLLGRQNSRGSIVPPPLPLTRLASNLGKHLALDYLSIDVAEQGGEFWLLDVNPLASWNYLEDTYDLLLTKEIIEGWLT